VSLPAGAKVAVLEGDPSKEGFFTMRLLLPDGFKIQPHWHPKVEHVTVISGTFNVGMGEKFDQTATKAMPAGTLALMVVVTYQLGRAAITDFTTIALARISGAILLRFRVNSAWLILGAAIAGWILYGGI